VIRTPLSRSKGVTGQCHQAALLSAALTRDAGAAVTVKTYWAWKTTATLRLLGGERGTGGGEGRWHIVAAACLQLVTDQVVSLDLAITILESIDHSREISSSHDGLQLIILVTLGHVVIRWIIVLQRSSSSAFRN